MITGQHEWINDISMEMDGLANTPDEVCELEYEDLFLGMSTYNKSYRMEYDENREPLHRKGCIS